MDTHVRNSAQPASVNPNGNTIGTANKFSRSLLFFLAAVVSFSAVLVSFQLGRFISVQIEIINKDHGYLPKYESTSKSHDKQLQKLESTNICHEKLQADINQSFHSWKNKSQELARKISPIAFAPSNHRPFVFFHLRKTGGTTMRAEIFQATRSLGLPEKDVWIPCHTDGCFMFDHPPRDQIRAVYASHVNYMEVERTIREVDRRRVNRPEMITKQILQNGNQAAFYHLDDDRHLFDCLTNLRTTVSRVVSCWNFRMIQMARSRWHVPPANELSPSDWEKLLPQAYDGSSGGCNNEIARIFGSLNDEVTINEMMPEHPFFIHEFNKIASRMSRCVIVVLERCEDSNKVLSHFIPWIKLDLCTSHHNIGKANETSKILQEGAVDAILSQNAMDELLFKFGMSIFEEQVRIASNN